MDQLTLYVKVNRLGFVFVTPAGIRATVVDINRFNEQVGHQAVCMVVFFNADLGGEG